MATGFIHGIKIQEIDSGTRIIKAAKSSVIGIIGTAPNADSKAFPLNTPVLIAGSSRDAQKLNNTGTLPPAIASIFDQIGALLVVVRVESEDDIIDNLKLFLAAESTVQVTPKVLIAPEFSHKKEVLAEMVKVAEKLKSIIVADCSNSNDSDAIGYAKEFGSSRVYLVDPWVKTNRGVLPASPFVAGIIAKNDSEKGFWNSPSNQEILGITGLSRPIDFSFGDSNCSANLLNEGNVATIIHQNGYRLWGNRTTSSDSKWQFLSVRRTADLINDAILRSHLWAIDRNITKTYLEDVSESVNAYLASLKAQGAILGGTCYPSNELNSAVNIQDGKVYFDVEFTSPYPAESITFRSYLTNDYINEVI